MIKRCISFLMLLCFSVGVLQAQTSLFVATNSSDSRDGSTWENAKATLSNALAAATPGTTIYMKMGAYNTSGVTIPAGVRVVGGFTTGSTGTDTTHRQYPGTHDTWETGGVTTILDAYHNNRMATVQGHLENCVIRNGYIVGNGAGVYIDGGTVSHCVLIRNRAESTPGDTTQGKGGGAYITNGGKLINSVLSYNLAREGLAVSGNDGELINNTITNNNAITNCGLVTDVDNHVYTTVVIGTQCWMAENLRTTHYPDGTPISASYWSYPSNPIDVVKKGLYYGSPYYIHEICPIGWHTPSRTEFDVLRNYLNANYQYRYNGRNGYIAKALASQEGWTAYDVGYPGNNRKGNNTTGFNAIDGASVFWTSSQYISYRYYYRSINYNSYDLYGDYAESSRFIRCLKDE